MATRKKGAVRVNGKNNVIPDDPDDQICATKQIASLLGITTRHVTTLVDQQVLTKLDTGKFPLIKNVRGYIAYLRSRIVGTASATTSDLQTEKIRLTTAQADERELNVAVLKGELVKSAEVLETWQSMIANARAKLISMPVKIAGDAIAATSIQEIEDMVRERIYEALSELDHSGLPEHISQPVDTGEQDMDTTTQPEGEQLGRQVSQAE